MLVRMNHKETPLISRKPLKALYIGPFARISGSIELSSPSQLDLFDLIHMNCSQSKID